MLAKILIIDDEADIGLLISQLLEEAGYSSFFCQEAEKALGIIANMRPDLVFLDLCLKSEDLDGLILLDKIKSAYPQLPVIMISGHGNIEMAVATIKRGAYDFIEKPFKGDHLLHLAQKALELSSLRKKIDSLSKKRPMLSDIRGNSPVMNQLRQMIERLAPSNSRIMLRGPSGSGKEWVARIIHNLSPRRQGSFVSLSAARMMPERIEAALFGITKAGNKHKIGAFEQANGGILYLDEIADMPLASQNKIIRVLTKQSFERVGGSEPIKVDVRIISSSAKDLEKLVQQGKFREDLYHRLAVVPLAIPPLAQYREDIPLLVEFFMETIAQQEGLEKCHISPEAMAILQAHSWPGNIRQLRNIIERLLILAPFEGYVNSITPDMLPAEIRDNGNLGPEQQKQLMALPLREARILFEKEYLAAQISRFSGNISKTAAFVGMDRSALYRKLRNVGL